MLTRANDAGEVIQETTPINSSESVSVTINDALSAEESSDANIAELLSLANAAADSANEAIVAAQDAADTLAANENPTAQDIEVARDSLASANTLVADASEAATTYANSANDAGEVIQETTPINSSESVSVTINDALNDTVNIEYSSEQRF
ncbi:MAG: hypothetical protein Q9M40_14555 [Sulfurimonas sp.]|nr:hypothetical protein [Sulfurimonas sp.]